MEQQVSTIVVCSRCGAEGDLLKDFYPRAKNLTGRDGVCKECRKKEAVIWREKQGIPKKKDRQSPLIKVCLKCAKLNKHRWDNVNKVYKETCVKCEHERYLDTFKRMTPEIIQARIALVRSAKERKRLAGKDPTLTEEELNQILD